MLGFEINLKDMLKWETLQLSYVTKMNVLPRILFLFHTITLLTDAPFKKWQKEYLNLCGREKT